jgi:hypothetical protein
MSPKNLVRWNKVLEGLEKAIRDYFSKQRAEVILSILSGQKKFMEPKENYRISVAISFYFIGFKDYFLELYVKQEVQKSLDLKDMFLLGLFHLESLKEKLLALPEIPSSYSEIYQKGKKLTRLPSQLSWIQEARFFLEDTLEFPDSELEMELLINLRHKLDAEGTNEVISYIQEHYMRFFESFNLEQEKCKIESSYRNSEEYYKNLSDIMNTKQKSYIKCLHLAFLSDLRYSNRIVEGLKANKVQIQYFVSDFWE